MKKLLLIFLTLLTTPIYAVQCYLTLMQGHCWKGYTVTIQAFDRMSGKKLIDPVVLTGKKEEDLEKFWKRVPFDCKPEQGVNVKATFDPPIWEDNKGKVYPGSQTIYLPETVEKGIFAWNVPVCFPKSFANVPIPPSAAGACGCRSIQAVIPKIKKPKKKKK